MHDQFFVSSCTSTSANTISPYTSLWHTAIPDAMSEAPMAPETLPQEGAQASVTAADRGGKTKSPSPAAPSSPSTVTERQIPVDPASLRRLGMVADEDSPLSLPSVLTELVVAQSSSPVLLPPLRRPTFVVAAATLPCSSAAASYSSPAAHGTHSHSPTTTSAALARLVVAAAPPSALSRSASRAEGRTMAPHDDDDEPVVQQPKTVAVAAEDDGGGFTCGALCMMFPGFSKKKPATAAVWSVQRQQSGLRPRRSSGASRVASLERFECGSWSPPPPPSPSPSPPPQQQHDAVVDWGHATEVAKTSCCAADDAEAPVKMAFVFDGDPALLPAATAATTARGILKNSASSRLESARPSTSQRHVRFSTAAAADAELSCPSSPCITPRLARARAEFHAFLEAQSA